MADVKGENAMTENELVEALGRIAPDRQTELDSLAKRVIQDSRILPRAAVAHMQDANPKVALNAAMLLMKIKDVATVPLLEGIEKGDSHAQVESMKTAVRSYIKVRDTTVAHLRKMLDDKSPMNYANFPGAEGAPLPNRVCDEAYVLLRAVMNTTEDEETLDANTNEFFRLPEERKDAEVKNARDSKPWTDFVEHEP